MKKALFNIGFYLLGFIIGVVLVSLAALLVLLTIKFIAYIFFGIFILIFVVGACMTGVSILEWIREWWKEKGAKNKKRKIIC